MKQLWQDDGTLDLKAVNRSEFNVVEEDGLTLVFPRKNKWDWMADERWLRSVVVDAKGRIVSTGWPKFGNYGEFQADTRVLDKALAADSIVRFTHKEDGSLCIRDVVNGRVMMRTRGTMFGGQRGDDNTSSYGEKFASVAMCKYPQLLDPQWFDVGISLLFEYVAPDNQVVVRYPEEDLILIGMLVHEPRGADGRIQKPFIVPWGEMSKFAKEEHLTLVELKELPADPAGLLEEVKDWRTEGVVVRCPDPRSGDEDQILVKVKSAWYLANHRMKHSMNYQRILEFVETSGIRDEQQLVDQLRASDFDFEIIESVKELYARHQAAEAMADEWETEARHLYEKFKADPMMQQLMDIPRLRRKEFAKIACDQGPVVKSMMFSMYDGNEEGILSMRRRVVATEGRLRK